MDAQSKAATSTTLAVTSGTTAVTTITLGSVVTLTASVTSGSTPLKVGQVNFCDASAKSCSDIHLLGTAQLTRAGTAVVKFHPRLGAQQYRAVFAGTATYASSVSAVANLDAEGPVPSATSLSMWKGIYPYAEIHGNGPVPTGTVSFLNTSNGNVVLQTTDAGSDIFSALFFQGLPANPATGTSVQTLAAGDFNGDGILDVATAGVTSSGAGSVVIWLGAGDGTFKPMATSFTTDAGLDCIAVGDFNGDGKLDLVVANGITNSVVILLGNGDGTYSASGPNLAAGTNPVSMAVGDFNGDGIADIVVANQGSNDITVLLGKGDGTFAATAKSQSAGTAPFFITAADFNGDGFPDVAVLNKNNGQNTLVVYLGKGDGTFTVVASGPGTGTAADGVAAADFDKDGIVDLAIVTSLSVTVLKGNGDGTFTAGTPSEIPPVYPSLGTYSTQLVLGEFFGDGTVDLFVSTGGISTVFEGGTLIIHSSRMIAPIVWPAAVGPEVAGDWTGYGSDGLATPAVSPSGNSIAASAAESEIVRNQLLFGLPLPPASGTAQVVASYSGDANYQPSVSAPVTVTAPQGSSTVNLTLSQNPVPFGTPVTLTATVTGSGLVPTGTVTFYDGSGQLASAALTNGVAKYVTGMLPAGSQAITAAYPGDTNYTGTTSVPLTLIVQLGTVGATLTVTPSAASITDQQSVTVNATMAAASGTATPTGTILLAGGSYSTPMTLANAGAAFTIPAGTLSAGTNTLTATYSGDGTFASETATTTITVAPVVMAAPTPSPVPAGGTATATVTLTAGSTYSGTMNLSCALKNSPANAQSPPTCDLSPPTVTIASGGNATTTLTAKTTGGTSANAVPLKNGLWGLGNRALTLATLLIIGMRFRRRWTWMVALVVMGIAFGIIGCGGHSSSPVTPPTTAGTYVFSVTATDSKNSAITSSANVSVKVQ